MKHSPATFSIGPSETGAISAATFSDPTDRTMIQDGQVSVRDLPPADSGHTADVLPQTALHNGTIMSPIPSQSSGTDPPMMGSPISQQVTQLSGFEGISALQGGSNPPDPQIASSTSYVMETTNFEIEIFTKQGVPLARHTFGQFFNNTRNVYGSLFDPKVLFDASSARWFASVGDRNANRVTIAVSVTSDPLGVWKIYGLSSNGDFPDQPIIGLSDDKFIVSVDEYATAGVFVGAQIWVLAKSQLVAGSEKIDVSSFGPMYGVESIHPVQSLSATTTLYMVSTGGSDLSNSDFHLYSVTGVPPGEVAIQTIPLSISPIFPSVSAGQPGTMVGLDTGQSAAGPGDARIQSAAWFQGMLWLTFDDGCTPHDDVRTRACFRLVQIDTGSPIVVKQDFDVGAKGFDYFYPAVSIDGSGNLAVVFGYSSAMSYTCCFASIAVTGQAAADPIGTFRHPITIKAGNYSETGHNFIGTVRYGDYFGASVDPSSQSIIWVAGEYLTQSSLCGSIVSCWATHVASMAVADTGFTLSTEPTYVTVRVGSSNTTGVLLYSFGGFAGPVILTTSVAPLGLTVSLSSSSLNLTADGSANSTLNIAAAGSMNAQSCTVEVTATSGSTKVSARIFVSLIGFTLSSNTTSLSLPGSSAGTIVITATSINGFSGSLQLAASVSPSGPYLSFTSASVMLAAESTASNLTIYTGARSQGIYTIKVTGTSGSETETITLSLGVGPFSIDINSLNDFNGVSVSTVGTVAADFSNPLTLSGAVRVTAVNSSTSASLFTKNYMIEGVPIIAPLIGGFSESTFLLDIPISPDPLASEVVLTFSGNATRVQVGLTRNPDLNRDGVVDELDANTLRLVMGCTAAMKCYNALADLNGDGAIDSFDLAILQGFTGARDFLADFVISALPRNISLTAYSQGACNVTLKSINGFVGKINVTASVAADGINTSSTLVRSTLATNSVVLAPNGSVALPLKISSPTAGDYAINVTGRSGSLSSSAILILHVADFRMLGEPWLTFIGGNAGSETILFTSINSFSGQVSLSTSISPNIPSRPTATINPISVWLSSGWTSAFVSISSLQTPVNNYTLTVSGSQGSTVHNYDTTLQVFDFSMVVTPSRLSVSPGNSTFVNVQGRAINGYANDVSVRVLGLPSCVTSPLANRTIVYVNRPGYPNSSKIDLEIGTNCSFSRTIVTIQAFDSSFGVYRKTYFTLIISAPEKSPQCDSSGTLKVHDECESSAHEEHREHEQRDDEDGDSLETSLKDGLHQFDSHGWMRAIAVLMQTS